jgi:ATP phosphoribosyltransferase regulatory subunit
MILRLAELNGTEGVLSAARGALAGGGPEVNRALDRLESIAAAMGERSPSTRLHFDLAELRGYLYERGVVFAAFVPGHGQEVARGGRYDGIGEAFGRARPAIGFSTDLRTLVACGAYPNRDGERRGIFAPASDCARLHAVVRELRARGERVVSELPGQAGGARDMWCDRILRRESGSWVVKRLDDAGA